MSRTHKIALLGALLLASALRLWGFTTESLLWHPDEFHFVYWPLLFYSGDLNPHFFSYPSLYFYLLAVVYGCHFLWQWLLGTGWTLAEWASFYFFWNPDYLLGTARLVSITFAVGTAGWVGLLAARVYTQRAGPIAALLLGVCTLHVRQSGLAAVDVPMTFWFVGCIWAAVRLLNHDSVANYVLAGVLVGLTASTKYPGALAGMAITAAHLLAGRSLWDRRIWLAGIVSLGAFIIASPYIILDFSSFKTNFIYETGHLQRGRVDLGIGWWYHLKVSLRHSLGLFGLLLTGLALIWTSRHRRNEEWVVLAGFLAYYLVMGSGRLVYVRYALPLAALQAVLVAGFIANLKRKHWLFLLLGLTLVEPLYGSLRLTQLRIGGDTRRQARTWVEQHVPPGTSCCNFGGWGGDIPLRTFTDQWWKIKYFERKFSRQTLDHSLMFLNTQTPSAPYYQYAIQVNNRDQAAGDMQIVKDRECAYAILHRHPLTPTGINEHLIEALAQVGKRVAHFTPEGLDKSDPRYDPIDSYYVPIGSFGQLQQTGPEIEIWRIDAQPLPKRRDQTAMEVFARGYALSAAVALNEARAEKALDLSLHALTLNPENVKVLEVLARVLVNLQRTNEAISIYQQIIERVPDLWRTYNDLALLYASLGQHQEAVRYYSQAVKRNPKNSDLHNNLGISLRSLGKHDQAIRHWLQALTLAPQNTDIRYNLGMHYYTTKQYDRAIDIFEQLLKLEPIRTRVHNNLAGAYKSQGNHDRAITHWRQVISTEPNNTDALYNICSTYQSMRYEPERAAVCWQQFIDLKPDDPTAHIHLANAYVRVGQNELARTWFEKVLQRFPDHPQADKIRQILVDRP